MAISSVLEGVSLAQWTLLAVLLVPILTYASLFRKHGSLLGAPPQDSEGIPGLGPLRFWTDRMAYMRDAGRRSKTGNYSFYVGRWPVIGLSGPSGRAAYYNSGKGMALEEGMNALVIGSSSMALDLSDENVRAKKGWNAYGKARLLEHIRPDRLRSALPLFFDDCDALFEKLGDRGSADPGIDVYYLAWKMSLRLVGPAEVVESPELLQKTFQLSLQIDCLLSSLDVFVTWLPTPARIKKTVAGMRLYMTLNKIIKARQAANSRGEGRRDDALQQMLDQGDRDINIVSYQLDKLFTAQVSTAQNAAAVLCYLGSYPQWQKRIYQELSAAASKFAKDPSAPLSTRIRDIPLDVWDSGLPVLYACLRDSIRIQTIGTFFRQNTTGEPIPLHPDSNPKDGSMSATREVVPPGAIIGYNVIDTAMDPDIYPDPDTWNPSRYLPGDEDYAKQGYKNVPYSETAWGAGKHVCTGQKLAKLEVHTIVAMFVARFEWELTDGEGKALTGGVPANWKTWLPTRHKEQYRLKYTRRNDQKEL